MDASPAPSQLPARALPGLIQGLAGLAGALPLGVVVCVQTARQMGFWTLGLWPAVAVTGWLYLCTLRLPSSFSSGSSWDGPLRRSRSLALLLWGLSPFLYWHARLPDHPWFGLMTAIAGLAGWWLLIEINRLLPAAAGSFGDPRLVHETRGLCQLNRMIFLLGGLVWLAARVLEQVESPSAMAERYGLLLRRWEAPLWMFFLVAPLALTLTCLWKTREAAWRELLRRAGLQ